MEILYYLIPLSLVLLGAIIGIFIWAVKGRQFEDLEGPAYRILMDDDEEDPAAKRDTGNGENGTRGTGRGTPQ